MSIKRGFTLIEVLVVVALLAIFALLTLSSFTQQRLRAEDTKAKTDLAMLKIAFENYYNDHSCYPPPTWFDSADDCGSAQFAPYLNTLPCDPKTGMPYPLETDVTGCNWFKLYAHFSFPDADAQAMAQRSPTGSTKGNYGISSSNVGVSVFYEPLASTIPLPSSTPSSTPTPSLSHNYYWCSELHNCTSFDPTIETCSPTYVDNPDCDGGVFKCSSIGTCNHL